jgi:hypothetical protein
MHDRQTNIDILFRNGLRDLEVLPPPEVWQNLAPVVSSRSRIKIFFSVAASVAVLIGMASMVWLLSDNIQLSPAPGTLTLNQDFRPAGRAVINNSVVYQTSTTTPGQPGGTDGTISAEPILGRSDDQDIIYPYEYQESAVNELINVSPELMMPDETPTEIMFPINIFSTSFLPSDDFASELSEVREEKVSRWLLGAGFSPSYSLRSMSGDPERRAMIESERSLISYSGGVSVSFRFSNRLSVSTGFFYSAVDQMIDDISAYSGFAPYNASKGAGSMTIGTTSGRIVTTNPDYYFFDKAGTRVASGYGNDVFDPLKAELPYSGSYLMQNFGYLELPMMLRYKLVDRVLDLNIIGGVSYGVLVGNSVNTISLTGEKIPTGYTSGVSPFNISSSMGMGMEYNLSGTLTFNLEPLLRYNITSLGYETTGIPHPWSFGVLTGFYFSF